MRNFWLSAVCASLPQSPIFSHENFQPAVVGKEAQDSAGRVKSLWQCGMVGPWQYTGVVPPRSAQLHDVVHTSGLFSVYFGPSICRSYIREFLMIVSLASLDVSPLFNGSTIRDTFHRCLGVHTTTKSSFIGALVIERDRTFYNDFTCSEHY